MADATIHMRAVHDFLGAPAFVVTGADLSHLPAYARAAVAGGVSVPAEWATDLVATCTACAAGAPCPAWDWAALARDGVTPRDPFDAAPRAPAAAPDDERARAAQTLGLTLAEATDPARVRAAHRRTALASHPDRGGDAAAMVEANRARDVLLVRCNVK